MTLLEQREELIAKLPKERQNERRRQIELSDIKVAKMRTRLKVHFDDLGLEQSMDALGYMCEKHGDQIRKNGEQYIAHPLSMACMFQCLKIRDDNVFATLLLHDVIEESAPGNTRLLTSEVAKLAEDLPVGTTVKAAVRLMTLSKAYPDESGYEMKRRYFQQLIDEDKPENKIATVVKGFDRWNNITTMPELSKRAIRKNVLETSILLLPVLKKAKTKWPREANVLFLVRSNIKSVNNILAIYNGITDLHDEAELKKLIEDKSYLQELA